MDAKIGDIVLLFDWVGGVYAAIVTGFYSENTISCTYFPPLGGIRIFNGLMHKSEAKPLTPYWDFRPSQKEPSAPEYPEKVWNKHSNFIVCGAVEDKPFPPHYTLEIKPDYSVEIKPRPYFENKPALGTFEWALVALKNGHKVRKLGWYEPDAAVKIDHSIFRLLHSGCLFIPSSHDLLATDWVLA